VPGSGILDAVPDRIRLLTPADAPALSQLRLGSRAFLAPGYLRIAGEWRDHVLFQRLADDAVG
jgi:hypothetical protein